VLLFSGCFGQGVLVRICESYDVLFRVFWTLSFGALFCKKCLCFSGCFGQSVVVRICESNVINYLFSENCESGRLKQTGRKICDTDRLKCATENVVVKVYV